MCLTKRQRHLYLLRHLKAVKRSGHTHQSSTVLLISTLKIFEILSLHLTQTQVVNTKFLLRVCNLKEDASSGHILDSSSVLDCTLDSIQEVADGRMLAKLTSMVDESEQPLHHTVENLSSTFSQKVQHSSTQ